MEDILVKDLPELEEAGPVQMALLPADGHDVHIPLLDVGVQFHLVIFDMEAAN